MNFDFNENDCFRIAGQNCAGEKMLFPQMARVGVSLMRKDQQFQLMMISQTEAKQCWFYISLRDAHELQKNEEGTLSLK